MCYLCGNKIVIETKNKWVIKFYAQLLAAHFMHMYVLKLQLFIYVCVYAGLHVYVYV